MCWFYMGIAQIALDPPPFSVKRANMEKKCSKPSWQALTPPGNVGKKCPKLSWQALIRPPPLMGNAHMEATHYKKGFPIVS